MTEPRSSPIFLTESLASVEDLRPKFDSFATKIMTALYLIDSDARRFWRVCIKTRYHSTVIAIVSLKTESLPNLNDCKICRSIISEGRLLLNPGFLGTHRASGQCFAIFWMSSSRNSWRLQPAVTSPCKWGVFWSKVLQPTRDSHSRVGTCCQGLVDWAEITAHFSRPECNETIRSLPNLPRRWHCRSGACWGRYLHLKRKTRHRTKYNFCSGLWCTVRVFAAKPVVFTITKLPFTFS